MINEVKDNSIIICSNSIKNTILLNMSKNKIIKKIKFIDINEFKKNYFGTYDINTIYYLMKNYDYTYDIAKYYLDNIFYNYDVLDNLYNELKDNDLLIFNDLFKSELQGKNIYIIGYSNLDKYLKDILDSYNATYINIYEDNKYTHNVYKCKDQSEELNFIFQDIISNHINELNKIYLVNVSSDYISEIQRLSTYYKLRVNLSDKVSLYSLKEVKDFINTLKDTKDINISLDIIKDIDIKNKVIDLLNKHVILKFDDISINILTNLLKNTCKDIEIYNNAINIINFEDMIDSDNYYYILNFNQGVVPRVYHDDDLISDKNKELLGLNTSIDKVLNYKNMIINILNSFKNVIITYKLKDSFNEYEKSYLIDELKLKECEVNITYNYSNNLNKLYLGMKLDDFYKYNLKDKTLIDLFSTYKDINYLTYDNKYKVVNNDLIRTYLNNKINLSYSSMNNYFKCKFRYYIENILKLNIYEDTFQIFIGNLYHDVLSKMYDDNFDFEISFTEYLKTRELSPKERFFCILLKQDLKDIINVIKYQDSKSEFNEAKLEENISIDKSSDKLEINFVGKVDKIKYTEIDGIKYVSIIDYKTGSVESSIDNINYGLNMQLPVYIYLIKSSDKNAKIIGFYLQKLLTPKKVDTEDQKQDLLSSMKLTGYTIDDENLISMFDSTYENSEVIKSMKLTSKGFSSYTKLVSEEDIENIIDIVDKNINEVIESIKQSDFEINPKRIDEDLLGCTYCKYKDICFRKEEDIKNITYTSYDDLKGGN